MRSEGYRTRSRQVIWEYLDSHREATVTVKDILDFLDRRGEKISPTTVYRYLDRLCDERRLMKYAADGGKKASYQLIDRHAGCAEHLHLQCSQCGRVIHLECDYTGKFIEHVLKAHDFSLRCENSILYGLCRECQKAK